MTRQELPPLLTLSGAVLEARWDRVGHITLPYRYRRPVVRENKTNPRCLIFGTRTIVAKMYHSTEGAQGCTGRAVCAAEYAVARNSYSRSRIVAGLDGPVLATRERGLQAEPSSIYDAAEGNCMM